MDTTQVKPSHLSEYIGEDVRQVSDGGYVFEAMCESIVELNNPEAKIENIAERFDGQEGLNPVEFATKEFDKFVHEDTYEIISYAQRNMWIEYTAKGLVEHGVADKSWLDKI